MPTSHTIYLVNLQPAIKKFWCFLDNTITGVSEEIYAHSGVFLSVRTSIPGQRNAFVIPRQYRVEAGASTEAVDSQVVISSSFLTDTDLGQGWLVSYTQDDNRLGPIITEDGEADLAKIRLATDEYDKAQEPINQWYGSMTYGIQTTSGFLGLTWSPDPSTTYEITPAINYYISVGNFAPNTLISLDQVKKNAAQITAASFGPSNTCTVTLKTDGSWDIVQGAPPTNMAPLVNLLTNAHHVLTDAHLTLIAWNQL